MNGLVLIAGVVSACFSLIALAGGIVMIFLGSVGAWASEQDSKNADGFLSFCIVAACFYLALACLLGIWVPTVCWIFVACLCIVGSFLLAVMVCFEEGADERSTV